MSRIQIPYEFFRQGLVVDASDLTQLGINNYYPGIAPENADYGFIAYHPSTGIEGTQTNDNTIVFGDGLFDVEIVLDRDADVDDLMPVEDILMARFHGKKFVVTTNGVLESCNWRRTFDLPYDMVNGTYPRRILRFEVVI